MIRVNDRDDVPWTEGITAADVMKIMGWSYPQLVVTINGTPIPTEDIDSAPIPDGASVKIIHIAHGG